MKNYFDAGHATEWMERNPYGYYNGENDYGYEELPLYLEEDCYEMDDETGNIKIDKQIYDDFVKDEIIHVCFVDEDDEPTMDYLMKSEDDNWIYCEVLG